LADLQTLRHSAAHVMAAAILRLFPGTKLGIGPAIDTGFYYDVDPPRPITPEDLPRIEEEMRRIVEENRPFVRRELSNAEARELFARLGQDYKLEILEDIPEGEASVYETGEFVDLCRGPHVPSAGMVQHFKLLNIAGAYWRGDERRPMLQRIYGTAFETAEELDRFLWQLEEAKKRDHRRLAAQLDLFSTSEEVGPGLILWHPKGATVRRMIEDFWKREHDRAGYQYVYTPHLGNVNLWKRSGHWEFYRDYMYAPMNVDDVQYLVKPMNCPFHVQIYKSKLRSYRDLPQRYNELGTVYRYERAGVLHGLLRVRGFTQDDAHIFCTPEQLEGEILGVLDLGTRILRTFGFQEYKIHLSVRDPRNLGKYLGGEEVWQRAEGALRGALDQLGLAYETAEGEAVFYGPKIDVHLVDALGRLWQVMTVQVDFNFPEKFDLTYVAEDGREHRPIMVHRAIFGSLERFFGILIEHYAGAFPVWLAPVQAVVIPIADRHVPYAERVATRLRERGFRVEVDARSERMNYKIREAQLQKVPYMLVVGDKEVEADTVNVRERTGESRGTLSIEDVARLLEERVASYA